MTLGFARTLNIEATHSTITSPTYIPVCYPYDAGFWIYKVKKLIETFPYNPLLATVLMHEENGKMGKTMAKRVRTSLYSRFPNFKGSYFLDSGGYKLFRIKKEIPQDEIYDIQIKAQGDIVAALDYPLSTDMDSAKRKERAKKSLENNIKFLDLHLKNQTHIKYIPYLNIHGLDQREVDQYIDELHSKLTPYKNKNIRFGFALGSLALLRTSRAFAFNLIYFAIRKLKQLGYEENPIHVFGVSGSAIPFLILFGADSFDSTSYFFCAKNMQVFNPDTLQTTEPLRQKGNYNFNCDCKCCSKYELNSLLPLLQNLTANWKENSNLMKQLEALNLDGRNETLWNVSLHNLEVMQNWTKKAALHLKANTFDDYFIEFLDNYFHSLKKPEKTKLLKGLDPIIKQDQTLYKKFITKVATIEIENDLVDLPKRRSIKKDKLKKKKQIIDETESLI